MNVLERVQGKSSKISSAVHPVLKKVYASRGVVTDTDLALELADLVRPAEMLNIDVAVKLLWEALLKQEKIIIVGDFDADGATSSALGLLCLRDMGFRNVDYLVPNRFEYGYGLTPEIVSVAHLRSPDLIVTVDNGISSIEGVQLARDLGIKVLVTDHHLAGKELPFANAIVNPNQPDCGFPSKALAGVGVVFYLMTALRAELRAQGWFQKQNINEPNMAKYLDIVALGTVADVVPLDQNNRRLVKYGLNIIRSGRGRAGIVALLEVAGRNHQSVVASDLGFAAGPRINAAGRLDDMSLGIECLLSENKSEAFQIALQLDGLNKDRKVIEQGMQSEALKSLDAMSLQADSMELGLCLYDSNWHQGVIGILASRIKDKFHRPSIIFADEDVVAGTIKGSARSIPGLHIRDLLDGIATRHPKLLSKFGGHAMAAGLSLLKSDFSAFQQAYVEELERFLDQESLQQKVLTDGALDNDCFNLTFATELRQAGPWGQNFPEPLFAGDFVVIQQRVLADKHLKMVLKIPDSELCVDAIAFNVEAEILSCAAEEVSLLYRLDVNEYRGACSLQLMVQNISLTGF